MEITKESKQEEWAISAEHAAVVSYLRRKINALKQAANEAAAEWRTYLQNVATEMKLDKVRFDEERSVFVRMEGHGVPQNGHNPGDREPVAERQS